MKKLLVANRGEIAVRIMHAAAELAVPTVALFSEDDAAALHVRRADQAEPLRGEGPQAYLDIEQILAVAQRCDCDAVHPGYGFLSENAAFAARAAERRIVFVGPRPETLAVLGDKTAARALAQRCGVPVLAGSVAAVTLPQAEAFLASLGAGGALLIKAVAGGGGRGMRLVRSHHELSDALARCASEAQQGFGNSAVYVEEFLPRARHIEVQVLGDGNAVSHFGERDCSIQRRRQKLIEIAPCPTLPEELRQRLAADAIKMALALQYFNAGTFEFLVASDLVASDPVARDPVARDRAEPGSAAPRYAFIEANPRLQVEHTVSEEVYGVDLVRAQLQIAQGCSLADLHMLQADLGAPRGFAIQVRINAERMSSDGSVRPSSGSVSRFELPSGPGVRTDTCGFVGYRTNPRFDPLLAKLIAHSTESFPAALARLRRALRELRIDGVAHNAAFLQGVLQHPQFGANRADTGFVEEHLSEIAALANAPDDAAQHVDPADPLAVLSYGKGGSSGAEQAPAYGWSRAGAAEWLDLGDGLSVTAPMHGTIVAIQVHEGESVTLGVPLLIMNAMKMEHVIEAAAAGIVRRIAVQPGETVGEGQPLLLLEPQTIAAAAPIVSVSNDLEGLRNDLAAVQQRHALTRDAARPEAVARRRKTGQRTARENIDDLCDPASFVEYGALAIAAQRQRRSLDDLMQRTPADGLIAGIGRINGELFGAEAAQCAVLSYDYTVLAGTQGFLNHRKKDRMFELIERLRLPAVFFTEGGGGRPGDTDAPGVAGLDCMAFYLFGKLSGLVPLVAINSGRCFAGNAALLGCADVVIATDNSNIGMGGPAMIEGGGLGVFRPEEVGPLSVQVANGVVDIAVADEAAAVRVAKQYLSYFQGRLANWECADQRRLRTLIPENRLRVYEVRTVIEALADRGSVLELRRGFAAGMVTALMRVEGRSLGVIANNPKHLAGAIDSAAADKAVRFMQLCDAFDLPILFLCDTPGIMVGPEAEKTALVRHCARMFVTGASLSVPFFTIVLRKGYGLGAQAMAGGSFKAPLFTVAWPTGEFGGMGLEGAVKLGFRKELEAVADPQERKQLFELMVGRAYEHGKGLNMATHFEIDDVIDPADSRQLIASTLRSAPPPPPRSGKKRPCVDTW